MTNSQAKSEIMQIYMSLSEEKKQALDVLMAQADGEYISRQAVIDCFKKWQPYMATRLHEFEKELFELPPVKPQKPMTEKVIKMRDATPEERESIAKYIKSISKPTGVSFETPEQEPCEDAISRQAVMDALCDGCELYKNGEQTCFTKCEEYHFLATLPPVTPQPKDGKWIDHRDDGFVECPFCGHATNCEDNIDELHYCFYCGAKMVEPQERSEDAT